MINIRQNLLTCSLALLLMGTSIPQHSHGQEANGSSQQGDEEESKKLFSEVARGVGKDKNSAIQDALKNAVQQSFGVFVESKESLTDGKFSEEIHTNSTGYIESYDVASIETNDRVFRVTVHARISSDKIVSRLEKARIPLKSGVTEIVLNLNKKLNKRLFERDRNAREAELLARWLQEMPKLKEYLSAHIVSAKEVNNPTDRDSFSIQTKIRYEYDWNRILKFNRQLDKFLRLSRISRSAERFDFNYNDVVLVSTAKQLHRLEFTEAVNVEFGTSSSKKPNWPRAIYATDWDNNGRPPSVNFSLPVLVDFDLALPETLPESPYESKLLDDWKVPKETKEVSLPTANVRCSWEVHQVDYESWQQMFEILRNSWLELPRGVASPDDGLQILATSFGKKPRYIHINPLIPNDNRFDTEWPRTLYHYFYGRFFGRNSSPIQIIKSGKSFSLPFGEIQSNPLYIDDLAKPTKEPKPDIYSGRDVFYSHYRGVKAIPWRDSARLTWHDGTPLIQHINDWETLDGKKVRGRFTMFRSQDKIVVIQLEESTEEVELFVDQLSTSSKRQLPVDVTPRQPN